ncbi:MAG TPA: hypothetical protein VF582_03480 [Allosphingosinicella sp.]|jgi:hypothetical protein
MTSDNPAKRPRAVTAIAWLLIITWVIGLSGLWFFREDDELGRTLEAEGLPERLRAALFWIYLVLEPVFAVGVLRGMNWARLMVVLTGILGMLSGGHDASWEPLLEALVTGIIAYFLFNSRADAFFGRTYVKA